MLLIEMSARDRSSLIPSSDVPFHTPNFFRICDMKYRGENTLPYPFNLFCFSNFFNFFKFFRQWNIHIQ